MKRDYISWGEHTDIFRLIVRISKIRPQCPDTSNVPLEAYTRVGVCHESFCLILSIHPHLCNSSVLETIRVLMASARRQGSYYHYERKPRKNEQSIPQTNAKTITTTDQHPASPYQSAGGGATSRGSSRAPSPSYFSHPQHHPPQQQPSSSLSGQNLPRLSHQQPNATLHGGGGYV